MAKKKKVFEITNAPLALTRDQSARQKRYFISMMIRTACFVLTVVLPSPYRWFALAGAAGLPYFAVVIANAGRETFSRDNQIIQEKPLPLD
jgi:Flp pilus assembly protein TadB